MEEEYRKKGLQAIYHIVKNKNNAKKIEKDLYNITLKNLTPNENLKTVYFLNILQISEHNISIPTLIKEGKLNWKHDSLKNMVFEEQEQDEFIRKPFEIEEGVTKCGNCGSERVYTYSLQCRGADEGSTTFATCCKCGSKWTYS